MRMRLVFRRHSGRLVNRGLELGPHSELTIPNPSLLPLLLNLSPVVRLDLCRLAFGD